MAIPCGQDGLRVIRTVRADTTGRQACTFANLGIGESTMTDEDSVRRATMLLRRAQQLTAAADRESANRPYLLSLAKTYRTAADELAPGIPDPAAELFSISAAKQTQ